MTSGDQNDQPPDDLPRDMSEAIDQMHDHPQVTLRMQSVIAAFLRDEHEVDPALGMARASVLIEKLIGAGLYTVDAGELRAFVASMRSGVRV